MKMMTKELEAAFAKQGGTDGKGEGKTLVLAHFFAGSWDWWATEYNPHNRTFFGLVKGFEVELGYFSMDELEQNSCDVRPFGGVERDLYWSAKTLADVRRGIQSRK